MALCTALVQAAYAVGHTKDTYLYSQFHHLAARRGKKRPSSLSATASCAWSGNCSNTTASTSISARAISKSAIGSRSNDASSVDSKTLATRSNWSRPAPPDPPRAHFHSSRARGAPRPFRMKNSARVGSVGRCSGRSHGRVLFGALSPYSSLTEVLRGTIACGA